MSVQNMQSDTPMWPHIVNHRQSSEPGALTCNSDALESLYLNFTESRSFGWGFVPEYFTEWRISKPLISTNLSQFLQVVSKNKLDQSAENIPADQQVISLYY